MASNESAPSEPASETRYRSLGNVLVVGGSGFLGHHIVQLLTSRKAYSKLTALDLKRPLEPVDGVDYEFGDITDYDSMRAVMAKIRPDAVIHTASPLASSAAQKELMYKVNVVGTKNLVRAAQETGVKVFVYTSSASVIHDHVSDLINADETYPLIMGQQQKVVYTSTKAEAELAVIQANRSASYPEFLTCAIRPAGIYGPGDMQMIPNLLKTYYSGKTKFQVGDNSNLFDFTEVRNVAHAHHLAAAALLATHADRSAIPKDETVDGEAFFVSDDAPVYFWDMTRAVWAVAGDTTDPRKVTVLPRSVGLFLGLLIEWICYIFRLGEPVLTQDNIRFATMTRYYNISKAKMRLGYRPVLSREDGVREGVQYALEMGMVDGQPQELIVKKKA